MEKGGTSLLGEWSGKKMRGKSRAIGRVLLLAVLFGALACLGGGFFSGVMCTVDSSQVAANATAVGDISGVKSNIYDENQYVSNEIPLQNFGITSENVNVYSTGGQAQNEQTVQAFASFSLQNNTKVESDNDTIASGFHIVKYQYGMSVYNSNDSSDTMLGNLEYTLCADDIVEVRNEEYADRNESCVKWVFPSNIAIAEDDWLYVSATTSYFETKYVPMSVSRRANKTMFDTDDCQLAEFNVTFENLNFNYAGGQIKAWHEGESSLALVNATLVHDTFVTNAPLNPSHPFSKKDEQFIEFNLDKSQLQANKTYNFSVVIQLDLKSDDQYPILYKPYYSLWLGLSSSGSSGPMGTSITMPNAMLPEYVHYASASTNVSNTWYFSRGGQLILSLEKICEPLGSASQIHVHKKESLSTSNTHIDYANIYNFTINWDANVWKAKGLDNVTYTITTPKNLSYINNSELYQNGTENTFVLPPTIEGENYSWVLPLEDRIGSEINFVLDPPQIVQDNPWVNLVVKRKIENGYTRVNVSFIPEEPLNWINMHVRGDSIVDVSVFPPEFELEMLTSNYVKFASGDVVQERLYNFSVLVDNPTKIKIWSDSTFGWGKEPPSTMITLPVAELGNVTLKADVPVVWAHYPTLPQYVQEITIKIGGKPIASFTYSPDPPFLIGQPITFNASSSYDPNGYITFHEWDFGDGNNATGMTVTHSYAANGSYPVKLTVTDNESAKDTVTKQIRIGINQPPIASFTYAPENPEVNQIVTFDASNSTDPDGNISKYQWDFGDGVFAIGRIATHSYSINGTYSVNLTVIDDEDATDTLAKSIIVNLPPIALFSYIPLNPIVNETITFDASNSTDLDGEIIMYQWDFGDENSASGKIVNHSYSIKGTYNVTLTITDHKGAINSVIKKIIIVDTRDILYWSGDITEDTIWNYPIVIVNSSVNVASGVKLTIARGTIVKFSDYKGLNVQGSLDVLGTPEHPVIITSSRDDVAGGDTNEDGDTTSPLAGVWLGLTFSSSTSMGRLENVKIKYAYIGVQGTADGAHVEAHNAILKNGIYGLYVYTPYIETEWNNCLIINNSFGAYVRASSAHVFRNCIISGNGFGIHFGAATLTLENTIVAFNHNGMDHSGDIPSVVIRNSAFYNPAGYEISWWDAGILEGNGNIKANPLFTDLGTSNYELSAKSPCIDSGSGTGASFEDFLGRPRYDDRGMPNVGKGYPSYVDIGAFERQEDTAAGDLAVIHLSNPDPKIVSVSDFFTVNWTVANLGSLNCTGLWQDKVYLSNDPYISPDDLLLETRIYNGTLRPRDSYTEMLTTTVPSTSGPKYIVVHTNANRTFSEADETNNVGTAMEMLAVDVPLLQLDTPITGTLASNQWKFYRFNATSGNTVLFHLDAEGTSGSTGLYMRYSLTPTISQYDVASFAYNQQDQEVRLLAPVEGTYYVGVYARNVSTAQANYTLSAKLTVLDIRDVSPNRVANIANATLKILGDNFCPNAEVELVATDGSKTRISGEECYQEASTLFATFNLAAVGVTPGNYDVVVTIPGPEAITWENHLVVVAGGVLDFKADFTMPGILRPGRVISLHITYTNNGTVDLNSPLLMLDSNDPDCEWWIEGMDEWVAGSEFNLLALSSNGPATVLRPGATESVTVKLRVPVSSDPLSISLSSIGAVPTDGSNNPIDWKDFESQICYECDDPETWDPVFARLQTQIGDTWGDYVATLRKNADRWFAAGRHVFNARELFRMELDKAYGLPTGIISGQVLDGSSRQPVPEVKITAWNVNSTGYAQSLTDADGSFALYGLAAGEGQISVRCHLVQSGKYFDMPISGDLFNLRVEVIEAGHVSGRVIAVGDNTPLENAIIFLIDSEGEVVQTTVTDNSGHYEFDIVAEDTYVLKCQAENYLGQAIEDVNVNLGFTTIIDFAMEVGGTIAGRVTNADEGEVLEGASVFAQGQNTSHVAFAETGIDGNYQLSTLPDDQYVVSVSNSGYVQEEVPSITITLGSTYSQLNIALDEAESFEISVLQEGSMDTVPYAMLIFTQVGQPVAVSLGGEDGLYTQDQLAPGHYTVIASALGYEETETSFDLTSSGLTSPLVLQLAKTSESALMKASLDLASEESVLSDFTLAFKEEVLRDVALGIATVFFSPNGGRLLLNYLGPIGPDMNRQPAPQYFVPNHPLSQQAKGITECEYPFSRAKLTPEIEIRRKVQDAMCNGGTIEGISGEVHNLVFYEPGTENPDFWDPGWSFGTTHTGRYQVVGHKILAYELIDSVERITVQVTVIYTFPDVYEFTQHHAELGPFPFDRYAYELGQAGWATSFRTGLQIKDTITFDVFCKKDPDNDGQNHGDQTGDKFRSYTPEDKFGLAGYDTSDTPEGGEVRYIPPGRTMEYRIEFWNKEDAPVPTQDAVIEDTLDPDVFDFSTLNLTRIGFLKWDMPLSGGQAIDTRIDCRPEMNIAVEVTANFDPDTGKVRWWFHCVDPLTGEYPEDPMAGFLPPFNPETGFEIGWVEFSVKPKANLSSGTQLQNQAFVEFDFAGDINDHPAPKEGPWINTIDAIPPVSEVTAMLINATEIRLQWAGKDNGNGSGIKDYTIYLSVDGGAYQPRLTHITGNGSTIMGLPGHTYAFYSIARDNVGNIEGTPEEPDALVVLPSVAAIFDTGSSANPYPSIAGRHNGTIRPNETITVRNLYTYACEGTGGHTEYVKIWNSTGWNVTATWNGYTGDWHNLTFNNSFTLSANETYNYTIRTGSYPQIIHEQSWNATGGVITCSEFTDVNGKRHEGWIPAIRLS